MTPETPPVWFITGCSTGFGRELAKATLARGYRTIVTARNTNDIQDVAAEYGEQALVLPLDVTDAAQVNAAVQTALTTFGQIDVLVNNAGIGYFASMEESDEAEVRRMFEINVFGLARMIQTVLPSMRERNQGMIVNISSIGGLVAFPALTYYNATKFAVEALSEGLAKELARTRVRVMLVEPSGFRTDWAGRSANEKPPQIAAYEITVGQRLKLLRSISGKQAGDPVRAVQAIITAVEAPEPPLRLLLGQAALDGARAKIESLRKDFDAWEETTIGADFPAQ